MKVGILGNCQMWSATDCIAALLPDAEIFAVRTDRGDARGDLDALADALLGCDVLLAQFIPPELFGPLATDRLVPRARRAVALPVISFEGLHPDCVYVFGTDGKPKNGPMNPYISALCMAAYLEDLPVEKAYRLFNAFTYAHLGYFDMHATNLAWLGPVAARFGFDLGVLLAETPPLFMHTVNHPKIDIIFAMVKAALRRLDVPFADVPVPPDPLARMGTWMVFPEIAARLGVPSVDHFESHGRRFGLRDMVQGLYESMPGWRDYVVPPAVLRARAFIRETVKGLPPPPPPPPTPTPETLSIQDVRMAFRLILGRDCESDVIAEQHAKLFQTLPQLRRALLASPEFRDRYSELA